MDVKHEPDAARFSAVVDGHEAEVDYEMDDGVMVLTHTLVPDAIGGRGVAAALVKAAFDHARAAGVKVRPQCSYAAAWARRHDDVADLLA